ncbi:phosphodiester glycosidase family protein [Patescibacteria group bacterium]
MKLPHFKNKYTLFIIAGVLLIYIPILLLTLLFFKSKNTISGLKMSYSEVKDAQENFKQNLSEELFNEHLSLLEKQNLESQLTELEEELEDIKETPEGSFLSNVNEAYELYGDFEAKVTRNTNVKLDVEEATGKIDDFGQKIIDQEFDELKEAIEEENEKLDEAYDEYVASLPPPPPPPSSGYSYTTVSTEKGSHGVYLIKMPLSSVKVKTVSASSGSCSDNCPTKSLGDYVSEYGAFAGINGSYFCPPDYSSCGGKVNSFDYALYHSHQGKWLNKDARSWDKTGLFTFKGGSFGFYKKSNEFGGGSVDAAISNYPSLLKNGEVVVKGGDLTSYQKIKGTRGALGMGGENIYLAIITNATVEEAAYAMRALGAKHALNLDGGGSSAMYIDGRYVVGPGRSLPNALLLTR